MKDRCFTFGSLSLEMMRVTQTGSDGLGFLAREDLARSNTKTNVPAVRGLEL